MTCELESVAHRYCELGIQLGIPLYKIRALEDRYRYTSGVERMLTEIVDWWLRQGKPGSDDQRWGEIVKILERLNERKLARKLHVRYIEEI